MSIPTRDTPTFDSLPPTPTSSSDASDPFPLALKIILPLFGASFVIIFIIGLIRGCCRRWTRKGEPENLPPPVYVTPPSQSQPIVEDHHSPTVIYVVHGPPPSGQGPRPPSPLRPRPHSPRMLGPSPPPSYGRATGNHFRNASAPLY